MSETPTAAMEAARRYEEACLHTPCGHICRMCSTTALAAYAAERIEEAVMDVQRQAAVQVANYIESRDAALAKLEAAESCTTCDGQLHASGSICICGGSGRRSDETLNLRQLAQATHGQLGAAEERVRESLP